MNSEPLNNLKAWFELGKLKIMVPVSLTGFTGYFIYNPLLSGKIIFISCGILLMAVAASVLNQIQEIEIDRRMERTSSRPLPSGRIILRNAFLFFLITFVSGVVIIYFAGNLTAALTGILTVFWYNVVYTYSKRITAFAVVPGAVTGALPPLIGWLAAGGSMWDRPIIFLEFLFFVGQIPHFWLLILRYGEDYKKAGLPSLSGVFNRAQINRLTFTWVGCSVFAALLLFYFDIIRTGWLGWILVTASVLLLLNFSGLLTNKANDETNRRYSLSLNLYFFLILILLICDRIIT
jgi:protoheme IX farnesyltransferase